MKLICSRGHHSDGLVGDRCRVRIPTAECNERLMREPALDWCPECRRGLVCDGYCSFCGWAESENQGYGHVLCRQWFETLEAFSEHLASATCPGMQEPRKVADKVLVSGRKRSASGVASRRRRDRDRKRRNRGTR